MNKLTNLEFGKILNNNLIDLDVHVKNKEDVLRRMVNMLYVNGNINDENTFFKSVMDREEEGVTGLGSGIAIPHGKSNSVKSTSLCLVRTQHPIEWESLDEEPVSVIILFAVKDTDADTLHIKLLQKVAILLADNDVLESVKNASTKEEVLNIFSN